MTDISRRGFLGGVAAVAATVGLPVPALPESATAIMARYRASVAVQEAIIRASVARPIFLSCTGIYNGVVLREVWDLDFEEPTRWA